MPEKSEKIKITATRAKISKILLIVLTMGLGVFITLFILNLLTLTTTREELFMTQFANYQLRLGIQTIKFENDLLKNKIAKRDSVIEAFKNLSRKRSQKLTHSQS